jgi:DNA repair exonuclease SbcCD ATPase subunit
MEANQHKQPDQAKLVALPGNLTELQLEDLLRQVYSHLLSENEYKRERIEELIVRLKNLEAKLIAEEAEKKNLHQTLTEESRKQEGTKQLINKLLEDIKRYQNDIDWYKRTYEKRSLLGVLRQKFWISRK